MTSLEDLKTQKNLGPTVPPTPHYTDYTQSLEKNTAPGGVITTATGFLEFKPRDSGTQAKYDAMQDSWEGVKSSEASVASGTFALDYASDVKERGAKAPQQQQQPQKQQNWCFLS